MLCSSCEDIFKNLEAWRGILLRTPKKRLKKLKKEEQIFSHSRLLEFVRAGAEKGCHICNMMFLHFEAQGMITSEISQEALDLKYAFFNSQEFIVFYWIKQMSFGSSHSKIVGIWTEKETAPYLSDGGLDPCSEASAAAGSWPIVSTWIRQCLEHHSQCNETLQGHQWWPTRLLQILEPDKSSDIRLIETAETTPTGPYLTLSHRWGQAQFLQLTTKNLDVLKAGIPIATLPKTFQDFVTVAKRLQVDYLWIDCLCIMQDSAEDWNRESLQMSEVYQYGYCNIAATGAFDSTGGLFLDRSVPTITPCRIEISSRKDPESREIVYIMDAELWENRIDKAPLISRAWVVQERLLAKRVLHFTKDQIFWECRENTACEAFPIRTSNVVRSQFKNIIPSNSLSDAAPESHVLSISKFERKATDSTEEIWFNILKCYTAANLTKAEDKEIALSGIVKVLEAKFSDQYTAGLWRGKLPFQLAWRPLGSTIRRADKSPYRAPSWSWLSTDRTIDAPFVEIDDYCQGSFRFALADVKQLEVTRAGGSLLGPINSGFLKLSGILRRLKFQRPWRSLPNPTTVRFKSQHDRKLILEVELDFLEDESLSKDSIWCVLIYAYYHTFKLSERGKLTGEALVLRRSSLNSYERIGISEVHDGNVFKLLSQKQQAMLKREIHRIEKETSTTFLQKVFGSLGLRGSKSKDTQDDLEDDPEEETITII